MTVLLYYCSQYHRVCLFLCFRPMTARTVVFYVTVGVHEFQQKLNVGVVINKDYKKLSCASLLLEVTYTQLTYMFPHIILKILYLPTPP